MRPLVSLKWATRYFVHARPKADEWVAATHRERLKYLNWASVLIRLAFDWHEDVDIENDDRIRVAVCEQALWLMRRTDQYPDVLTKGVVTAAAGPISATFSKDFVAPLICEEAKLAVSEIGDFKNQLATVKTMPLGL